jgi:hypothetical protein
MQAKFYLKNLKKRDHFEDLGVNGKIILKLILKKEGVRIWIGFICLRQGTTAGCCEHSNEPSQ